MHIRCIPVCLIALSAAAHSAGQTPLGTSFTYQGQLKQSGQPVTGTANLTFSLWDAAGSGSPPSGGVQLGSSQMITNVPLSNGLFTVALNAAGEFGASAFSGSKRWLQISVNGTGLSPRQELRATPHALFALNADLIDGLNSTAFLQSIPVPLTLSGTSATHIIRADNASTFGGATGIFGAATASTGFTYGGRFDSSSSSGTGMFARATAASGTTYGVYGLSISNSGTGVTGWASAADGTTTGVHGISASASGRGVFGQATASSGATTGVHGISTSPSGRGVFGEATASSGYTIGVSGQCNSSSPGTGIYGYATGGTPLGGGGALPSSGVYGRSDGAGGVGVFGAANSTAAATSYGMYGQSISTSGRGLYGLAFAASGVTYGVYGKSDSPTGYGIYGQTNGSPTTGYAVYAGGDLGASGTKAFRIDHPDDPTNKFLLHYSAESPEVINFYSGNVVLDDTGQAEVELPHYFARINKDPRYSLTAVGAPMPMLHVAREISAVALSAGAMAGPRESAPGEPAPVCSFRIAGGAPGAKVSWEVKAVRNDLRMRARAARVEVEKTGCERGKYQHPEFYGQPAEMGMNEPERAKASHGDGQ